MKTREWKIEKGGWQPRSVVECGGKQSATPLWEAGRRGGKRRRRCAMPAQSKTWRIRFAALALISVFSVLTELRHQLAHD
jgi:hypothetical protein